MIDIHFINGELSVIFLGQFLHDGGNLAARPAPVGIEIYDGSYFAFVNKGVRAFLEIPYILKELAVSELFDFCCSGFGLRIAADTKGEASKSQ